MGYTFPTIDDFKAQFARDFPYAVPAWGAKGTAVVTAGALTAVTVTKGGQGYTGKPDVSVTDSTGPGAGAVVAVTVANGKVDGLTITTPGAGYLTPVLSFSGGAYHADIDSARRQFEYALQARTFKIASQQQRAAGMMNRQHHAAGVLISLRPRRRRMQHVQCHFPG